jgi:hypothetical protein
MSSFQPTAKDDPEQLIEEFHRHMEELADERERRMQEFTGRLNEDRHNRQQKRQQVACSLARISPTAQLSLALMALAETSPRLKDHYHSEAAAYQQEYARFMKSKTGVKPGRGMVAIKIRDDEDEDPAPIDPHELPVFRYNPLGFGPSLRAAVVDLGLLVVGNLVFFSAAIIAFGRYDVR